MENIVSGIPLLTNVLPKSLLAWRETKCCSTGVVDWPGAGPITGWAIHEKVTLR
jgi:hypothetical protein